MSNNLKNRINIGKDTEAKLLQVGIDSFEKLESLGSENAFLRIQTLDPGACLSLLCALEGAIEGVRWHDLPSGKKQELIQFFKIASRK
jgi:DNA transformation protein and related proteins